MTESTSTNSAASEPRSLSESSTESLSNRPEPWPLRFAWLVVLAGAMAAIALVLCQLVFGLPFEPSERDTSREVLNTADETITLNEHVEDDAASRDALFRALAGIAALTAGVLAWGRLEQSRRQHALERAANERAIDAQRLGTRAQVAAERGQVTERFTRAVEQLNSDAEPARLGALYALERLAHDDRDQAGTIYEVVCACARHHSAPRDRQECDGLAVDLRAAIAIALRAEAPVRRNLRGVRIARTALEPQLILADVDFAESIWEDVSFAPPRTGDRYQLVDVSFDNAQLSHVTFLPGTTFQRVTFERDARLDNVRFRDCNLNDVRFAGHVTATSFDSKDSERPASRMEHVRFSGRISRCSFRSTDMTDVRFDGALVEDVDFRLICREDPLWQRNPRTAVSFGKWLPPDWIYLPASEGLFAEGNESQWSGSISGRWTHALKSRSRGQFKCPR